MKSTDLLILDGESRTTLGIVRNLSKKGISIAVGSLHKLGRSYFSRHAKNRFYYNWDAQNPEIAHETIFNQVKFLQPRVVMPVLNQSWQTIYQFYDEYERLSKIVPNPGKEQFEKLTDKAFLSNIANQNEIPIPQTFCPQNEDDAMALIDDIPFPVLLKPKDTVGGVGIQRIDKKRDIFRALRQFSEMPIFQEFIEGEDLELTILCDHGQPIAGSVYLSLRNYPLPYGPPVACRTIRDDALMALGATLLEKINYHGVAHMDFRRDKRDGQAKLLDFNARLAGTNDVSLVSGVDFGHMLYRMALDHYVEPLFEYEVDREFRWVLFSDLKHLLKTSQKLKTLRTQMQWRNVSTEISLTDPMPHFAIILEHLIKLVCKDQTHHAG